MYGAKLACQTHVVEIVGLQGCMVTGMEEHGALFVCLWGVVASAGCNTSSRVGSWLSLTM